MDSAISSTDEVIRFFFLDTAISLKPLILSLFLYSFYFYFYLNSFISLISSFLGIAPASRRNAVVSLFSGPQLHSVCPDCPPHSHWCISNLHPSLDFVFKLEVIFSFARILIILKNNFFFLKGISSRTFFPRFFLLRICFYN